MDWYEIKAKKDNAEILIYEQIGHDPWSGEGVGAKKFVEDLNALKVGTITLRINSPGGNVFDGNAIYNALKAHKAKKHVKIDGLAASIASIIAMAGDTIEMPENAMLMIHKASGLAMGNAEDMLSMASALEKIDEGLIGIYHARGNLDRKKIARMMGDETWITAQEAVEFGLADTITEQVNIQNCFTGEILGRFKNVPDKFKPTAQATVKQPQKEEKQMDITLEFLNKEHPDLVAQIEGAAASDALDQGNSEGFEQGAKAERERIKSVEDQLIPGHEALIETLKFDGSTTGEQAAVKVLQSEKTMRADLAQKLKDEAPDPVPHAPTPEGNDPKDPKAIWDQDAALRAEFLNDFNKYSAFTKAEAAGQIRIVSRQ